VEIFIEAYHRLALSHRWTSARAALLRDSHVGLRWTIQSRYSSGLFVRRSALRDRVFPMNVRYIGDIRQRITAAVASMEQDKAFTK
jgi:hypothetical protein